MKPIDISSVNARQSLHEIAKMAYGSGSSEKTAGGKGNIGILNGHVVKFNTHLLERMGSTTDDMRASCDALRMRLSAIAEELLIDPHFQYTQESADRRDNLIASIRRDLGMSADGEKVETRGLLDRTVVAKVVKQLGEEVGEKVFRGMKSIARELSSDGINTSFSVVKKRLSPNQLVVTSYKASLAKEREGNMIRESLRISNNDVQGKNAFYSKAIDTTTEIKIRDNKGGGSCFFYSTLQQMANGELEKVLLPEDREKLKGDFKDNADCANALRKAFITHSKKIVTDVKTSLQSLDTGSKSCFIKEYDFYRLRLTDSVRDRNEVLEVNITEPMELIESKKFQKYSSDADVVHGAFLADFLQRPVTIVMSIARQGVKSGESDPNERVEFLTFNRSLKDDKPLEGEPIVIFYNRNANGNSGHFRAVSFSFDSVAPQNA